MAKRLLRCGTDNHLKIMDPKMDSGLLTEGESLEDEYDVTKELNLEEVIGVMDQLLCFEVRLSGPSIEIDQIGVLPLLTLP